MASELVWRFLSFSFFLSLSFFVSFVCLVVFFSHDVFFVSLVDLLFPFCLFLILLLFLLYTFCSFSFPSFFSLEPLSCSFCLAVVIIFFGVSLHSFINAHASLLTAHCPLYCLLLTNHCPLLTDHLSPPTVSPLATHCLLPTACFICGWMNRLTLFNKNLPHNHVVSIVSSQVRCTKCHAQLKSLVNLEAPSCYNSTNPKPSMCETPCSGANILICHWAKSIWVCLNINTGHMSQLMTPMADA